MDGIIRSSNAGNGTATIISKRGNKTFAMTREHLKNPDGPFPEEGDIVKFGAKKNKLKKGSVIVEKQRTVVAPSSATTTIEVQQPGMPYQFVPIVFRNQDDEKRLSSHVPRDGSSPDQKESLLSGKIDCELTALTPLLVGQFRYQGRDVSANFNNTPFENMPADKGILEPLFYSSSEQNCLQHSRVLLSGAGLKGMLRHSLGAILMAPMERVQEQKHSYRPNISPVGKRFQFREAIVDGTPDLNNGKLKVKILPRGRNAKFLNTHEPLPADSTQFSYTGGIDGDGKLAWGKVYRRVAVANDNLAKGRTIKVPQVTITQYLKTQKELADSELGHLSTRHPNIDNRGNYSSSRKGGAEQIPAIKTSIRNHTNLTADQLIFVEVDTENSNKIVSFGHHFRYRWRYADTIRTVQRNNSGENETREEVKKLSGECLGEAGGQLSGVRSLLGYVDDDLGIAEDRDDNFKRLAGRISINTAVEQVTEKTPPDDRFVVREGAGTVTGENIDESRYNIPLKILGQPKPSADQWYLDQQNKMYQGQDNSYGYLPGHEASGVPLAGRKFYNHQQGTPSAFTDMTNSNSNQSTLARFISKPGAKFRFTVRFRDLRDWELGAVLLTLDPELALGDDRLKKMLPKFRDENSNLPKLAQKLGYAKSLGLGSIKIGIKDVHKFNLATCDLDSDHMLSAGCVEKFGQYAEDHSLREALRKWFGILNYASGQYWSLSYRSIASYSSLKFEQLKARRAP